MMGVRSIIRGFRTQRRERIQANTEKRAKILEKEAQYQKSLEANLKRQKTAQEQINRTRDLKHKIRKEKFQRFTKPIKSGIGGIKKYRKAHKGPQFGLGGGGGSMGASNKVWTGSGFETRTPTKKKQTKKIVIYQ